MYKAHKCFEMAARLVSMTFATIEAEEDYRARIAELFHEFVMQFVETLSTTEISNYGLLFTKLRLCLKNSPELAKIHAQSIEATYAYQDEIMFEVRLKHKELRFRDLLHINGMDEAVFTLNF